MTRLRDNRGGVLVLAAVMIPVFLVLTGLVAEAGNWFTRDRQLQNRADAAAFAAGIAYGENWQNCAQDADPALKAQAAQAIANVARQYAGDPEASDYDLPATVPAGVLPTLYNDQITLQSNVDVVINSRDNNYTDDWDYTDDYDVDNTPTDPTAGTPCLVHTSDPEGLSAPGHWTDVKVTERDAPAFFLWDALSPDLHARARVEIRPAISGHRFLPLAIPDNIVTKVQVRYFDQCADPTFAGTPLLVQDLAKLPAGDSDAYEGGTLWAVPNAAPPPPGGEPVGDKNRSVALPLTAYDPADCGSLQYRPIVEQVRLASSPDVDMNADCDSLKRTGFADCFNRLSQIRIWAGSNPNAEPRVHDVHVLGGCPSPSDGYFGTVPLQSTQCPYGVSVAVDWGDRDDGNKNVDANFTVEANGVQLGLQSWDQASEATYASPANALLANAGGTNITISVEWYDDDPTHTWDGKACVDPPGSAKSPCIWTATSQVTHGTFVGVNSLNTDPGEPSAYDPNATGAVEFVHTSLDPVDPSGAPGPSFDNWHPSSDGGAPCVSPCQIYPTVGIRSALTSGNLTVLRLGTSQGSQLVNCDPDVSQPLTLFKYGCEPWFGPNDFTDTDWWDPSRWASGCPSPPQNYWFSSTAPMPYTNAPENPWRCVVNRGGVISGQAGDWMAVATDNCKADNGVNCQTFKQDTDSDVHCGNYDGKPAQGGRPADPNGWLQRGGDSNDPRVISLFIVPYQSLKTVGGGGSGSPIPVLRFASFYVMNWLGGPSGNENDPCPDPDFDGTPVSVPTDSAIIGVFDSTVNYEQGPVDPNAVCRVDIAQVCRAVLVR